MAITRYNNCLRSYYTTDKLIGGVDTGNVAGFEPSVQMDIQTVPGRVWLQTMPIYNVANAIFPFIPTGGNNRCHGGKGSGDGFLILRNRR